MRIEFLWLLSYYYYFSYYLKYSSLKASKLEQALRPGSTLTQPVKQPYSKCCLTGCMFKEIQWGNVDNIKMMSRNTSSLLNLAYPNICVWFLVDANHSCIPKNIPSLYLVTGIGTYYYCYYCCYYHQTWWWWRQLTFLEIIVKMN